MISRRSLFGGFAGLLAAPAIVKASSLMAVKPLPMPTTIYRATITYDLVTAPIIWTEVRWLDENGLLMRRVLSELEA